MPVDVDDALRQLGKWSKWQVLFYLILSISNTFPASWHMLAIVFLGGQPDYHCKLPDGAAVNESIPYTKEGQLEKCSMYLDITQSKNTTSCDEYHYYGDSGPTIVHMWDLVCDRSYLVETTQTVMVVGVMVGAMGFSYLSDMFGRRPVFLFSEWAMVVVGVSTAFVTNYYLFAVLRFFAGALQQGIILTGFVMACELFPAEMRTVAGTAIENFWALGMCILALFAYLIRNWTYLQLTISIPAVLTIVFYWILPESVPWLTANDRLLEAENILKKAAKFNGKEYPEGFLVKDKERALAQQSSARSRSFMDKLRNKQVEKAPEEEQLARYTLLDILKHPKLRMYAIIMCMLWFVNSLVYYGLSLSTSALAGDRYLNFFLSGLVEIPAYTASIFILQKWGRRWPLAVFHIVAGIALGITLFIPEETSDGTSLVGLIMALNMIGKFGITGSFGTVFLYAPEIFPTTVRNQAMGISSLGGRLGNMIAPFSSFVARILPWLPGILFGSLSIIVGLLALLLPETLNRPLPQTIEDIENWSKPAKSKDDIELSNDTKTPNAANA